MLIRESSYLFKVAKDNLHNNDDTYMASIMVLHGYSTFLKNKDSKNKYENEISIIKDGQNMMRRLFGTKYDKNRGAAISHVFLSDVYEQSGNNTKAIAEYILAEQMLNNFYGSKQLTSSDISDLYAKLAIINTKLNEPLTAQIYLTKLQQNFGHKHPKTIKVTEHFIEQGMLVGY
jgi:hypothetical protein